ncbi:alanine racemase [Alteraurantiacibacter aquimixticola]|uniref:alanine racemase n=1 Tax=Alteraurantiacibacter aquimixticola TaxID=2489173 RepID=A0A4T3F1Z6_9SPHN|nr:alanine racemase [Alteraurantiacibacter aquimixticola]TIX50070.1 alanine racemase [Alteraurantiacibacter aquimixticola]
MSIAEPPPATLRLRIDREALADNWRALARLSGKAKAGAAVKADAYGIGIDHAVPTLRNAGCEIFFVAHWGEVTALLPHVPAGQVAVLHGVGSAQEAQYARATGAIPVIDSLKQAALWQESGGGRCHLMVDTGINRLGIAPSEAGDPAVAALEVDVLMSHLASADEDVLLNALQLERFSEVAPLISHKALSLANSAGIALGSDYAFDLTRPGLALYGGIPRPELEGVIRQVAFPEAAVIQRRRISAGDSVGYNALFTATREMEVATVSIGYADGFLRSRGPGTMLHFEGHPLPVIGRVSMDMIVVDCSTCETLREGDFLAIPFALPQVSAASGLSQYELLTTLGSRFDRCT